MHRRRFAPSAGFDCLEQRVCLDGDGSDLDPALQALCDDVDAGLDAAPETGHAVADIAANSAPDAQDLIDVIEEARASFNKEIDEEIKEEVDFQKWIADTKASLDSLTASWPQGWRDAPAWGGQTVVAIKYQRLDAAMANSQQYLAGLQQEKVTYNQAIDDLESRIWLIYGDTGQQDSNGNEIIEITYNNDSLYLVA